MTAQYCEPAVSTTKFARQLDDFRALRPEYERRGWFLVDAEFPEVFVVMAVPQTRPPALLCGVLFDYTNYDAAPPSVRLVDPFSRQPYCRRELPTVLPKALPAQALPVGGDVNLHLQAAQPLMQAASDDDIPFLCTAGTLEYHSQPGHSGNVWELHRASGAGTLVRLLEVIDRYGIVPIRGYGVELVPKVGFDIGPPSL